MDEQLQHRLEEARQRILAADARLRFYAYVPVSGEDVLENARSDWYAAADILWESLRGREQVVGAIDAFTNATEALTLLIDTLAVGPELPEELPPGTV